MKKILNKNYLPGVVLKESGFNALKQGTAGRWVGASKKDWATAIAQLFDQFWEGIWLIPVNSK
jgi:hypothetical protein